MGTRTVPSHRPKYWDHDLESCIPMSLRSGFGEFKELAAAHGAIGRAVLPTFWDVIDRLAPALLRRTSNRDNAGSVDQARRHVSDRGQIPPL